MLCSLLNKQTSGGPCCSPGETANEAGGDDFLALCFETTSRTGKTRQGQTITWNEFRPVVLRLKHLLAYFNKLYFNKLLLFKDLL